MANAAHKPYPGSVADARGILLLAGEYGRTAHVLLKQPQKKKSGAIAHAPARLLANHALELYLNAYLRHLGVTPEKIREINHNYAEKIELASDINLLLGKTSNGLKLKQSTENHLMQMTSDKEYLSARYSPRCMAEAFSEIHRKRLAATLEDIATKIEKIIQT